MIKFYVHDTTIGKFVYFNSVKDLVFYLGNTLVPRAFKKTRAQYIQHLIDLGHGYDDIDGVTLTRAVAEQYNIGILRDGKHVRTDVHAISSFKDENYGD
jgi:hypothetical protein